MNELFIRGLKHAKIADDAMYPYDIPAVRDVESITFNSPVTFFVGENGSGKSTILEAIAVTAGFNAEGGTKNYNFSTENSTSELANTLTLIRGARREKSGFFLRAESFYTTANYTEKGTFPAGDTPAPLFFDDKPMHQQSHGEAFMAIVNGFQPGLFLFDEPESALSPQRLLQLMVQIHELAKRGSQFIIATHSPILLAYPGAQIYEFTQLGVQVTRFEELDHVNVTRNFLNNPGSFLKELFEDQQR
jgi:predicted ATPase